ncbi:hypothetical protein JCM10207_001024 [Rhodosporidiobolus poonsookiae]
MHPSFNSTIPMHALSVPLPAPRLSPPSSSAPHDYCRRSSAALHAAVPTADGSYPPIRTITPRSPDLEDLAASPPPPFHNDYPQRRSPSMNTFASEDSEAGGRFALVGFP